MDGWTHGWLAGWLAGWMDGWMDSWTHGLTESRSHGVMDSWTHGVTESRSHGVMEQWSHGVMESWSHGWLAGWLDGWMDGWICCHVMLWCGLLCYVFIYLYFALPCYVMLCHVNFVTVIIMGRVAVTGGLGLPAWHAMARHDILCSVMLFMHACLHIAAWEALNLQPESFRFHAAPSHALAGSCMCLSANTRLRPLFELLHSVCSAKDSLVPCWAVLHKLFRCW